MWFREPKGARDAILLLRNVSNDFGLIKGTIYKQNCDECEQSITKAYLELPVIFFIRAKPSLVVDDTVPYLCCWYIIYIV